MIYFDNAATTYPKPEMVIRANMKALVDYGGNPGRAGHKLSMDTAQAVYNAREKCAKLFGAQVENTIFTINCTHALNFAIKGVATRNCHIITTDLEHNAVIRPIYALSKANNISYSVVETSLNDDETLNRIEQQINPRTKLLVCTAACNVTGQILPYERIGKLCQAHNICFILDCAQGAGVLPIKLSNGINIICCPGHKGLYGPMGSGLLITDGKFPLSTIIEGGTGSNSTDIAQPDFLPDRLESGTINATGAIALGAGIDFVNHKGVTNIYHHEMNLCRMFLQNIKSAENIQLYQDKVNNNLAPVISFNVKGVPSTKAAQILSDNGYYLRGGFHCNFLAHKKLGTIETGTVRFAPSVFNSQLDVMRFVGALRKIKW